jgi:hypothetical protein
LPKCLKSGASLIAELAQNSVSIMPVSDSEVRIREWHATLKEKNVDSEAMLSLLTASIHEVGEQLAELKKQESEQLQIKTGGMELAKGLFLKSPDVTPNLPELSTPTSSKKLPEVQPNVSSDNEDDEISNSSAQTAIKVKSEPVASTSTPTWTSKKRRTCPVCHEKFIPLHKEHLVCNK